MQNFKKTRFDDPSRLLVDSWAIAAGGSIHNVALSCRQAGWQISHVRRPTALSTRWNQTRSRHRVGYLCPRLEMGMSEMNGARVDQVRPPEGLRSKIVSWNHHGK